MSDCKCSKCGNIFPHENLIAEPDYDYPGGPATMTYVSPCCGAGYRDEW